MSRPAFVHTDEPDQLYCPGCLWAFSKPGICGECGEEVVGL